MCLHQSYNDGRTQRCRTLLLLLVMAIVTLAVPVFANQHASTGSTLDSPYYSEYEIKAGFIYRFISFVSWPDNMPDDGTITIAILGPNPFGDAFRAIEGSKVGDRDVSIRYFSSDADHEDLRACQVLYIGAIEDERLDELLRAMADSPVLTIGDSRGFIDRGGIIGFIRQDRRRIGIEINAFAASRAGLTIRSMLKRIAGRIIEQNSTHEGRKHING